ncbi:MAG: cupin domain-containing protein [Nanoarchaeota archaeon]
MWKIKPTFQDERGSIYDILEGDRIKHVGIIISEAKSIRANHYHKKSTQWTYVIDGKIIVYTKDSNKKYSAVKKIEMKPGDMIELPPLTIHAVETLEKSKILVLTNQSRINNGYEYDTFKVKII